ncbi:MAG: TonB-dependent receptor domain-containing protein [Candidatus Cyclobacteriaceae bacterium M3_2C_046]
MFKSKVLFFLMGLLMSLNAMAQTGTIRGTIIDDATGEALIGVTVLIKGTTQGATTDLEGTYAIKAEPGSYSLQISYVSYETIIINDVNVDAGDVTQLGTIRMKESVEQLSEVVVTAEAIRSSETALLTVKKKSANLLDGISSETFKRIGDSDAAGAIKRVPGVSIEGGQYVYVRGLGDRYTKTVLNTMAVPGLDPDRNAIQIDIFPTNLIGNIVVYKTFTPDLFADFVGGTVNIETKEFPEERTFNISASVEYIPSMHFRDDFLTYEGGSTDFLGFDDGTRDLPFDARNDDIPSPGTNNQEVREITQSFDPAMAAKQSSSLPNISLGLSAGDQFEKTNYTIGYNAALSYSNKTTFYDNAIDAFYIKSNIPSETELEKDTRFFGPLGLHEVQLNGLLGLAVKTSSSKISLQGLHIQNGIERSAERTRVRSNENFNTSIVDNLEYTERSLTNLIASGEHRMADNTFEIKWAGGATYSTIDDKDVRITPFTEDEDDGSLSIQPTEGGEPNRIWRLLEEQNYVGKLDFAKDFKFRGLDSKLKFGASNIYKTRQFEIQDFFLTIRGSQEALNLNGDPDRLLVDENIISESEGLGTAVVDRFVASNSYDGRINVLGGYVMGEFGLTEKLRTILGVRAEQYDQFYTGLNQEALSGSPAGREFEDENVLSSLKFFPSVNLIYNVIENSNLRASFSRTVARPSFKELSTAEIQDVLTGRTFIGNINLVETDINNYDLRWEYFLERGQMVSIGGFYKTFENPIELVRQPLQPTDFKPTNVGDAEIIGIEFEARKNLDFIAPMLRNFSIISNLTWTEASVKIDSAERAGREIGLREGQELNEERDFLGQPPLTINVALNFISDNTGWDASLSFNRQSSTLAVVGINRTADTYTVPFNSLNFNITKSFGPDMKNTIGFRVTNILDDNREQVFRSFMSPDFIESRRDPGRAFQLRFSRSF